MRKRWYYAYRQKRWFFQPKIIDIFLISAWKDMLWGLIRSASVYEALLMSTHNICFHAEKEKYSPDIYSYVLWYVNSRRSWSHEHAIIGIKHGSTCINICQVPWEVLKTEAEGRGFQHLPRDPANVNALKNHVQMLLLHKTENICYILRYFLHYFVSPFHRCSQMSHVIIS